MKLCLGIVVLLSLLNLACSQEPVTMDLSDQIGSDGFKTTIMGMSIPDQNIPGSVNVEIKNIQITDFSATKAMLINPHGMHYTLKVGGIKMTGSADIKADTVINFFFFSKHVEAAFSAEINFDGVHIDQGVELVIDETGLSGQATGCTAVIDSVDIKLDGHDNTGRMLARLYNGLSPLFADKIRDIIQDKVCDVIKGPIDDMMEKLDMSQLAG